MRHIRKIITAIPGLLISTLAVAQTPRSTTPIIDARIVFAEGFYSCTYYNGNVWPRFQEITTRLQREARAARARLNVEGIWGCFDGGPVEDSSLPTSQLFYRRWTPARGLEAPVQAFPSAFEFIARERLRNAFTERRATPENTYAFVAGHSHGAWLALRAATRLPTGLRGLHVMTIDPISYVNCPGSFLFPYYSQAFHVPGLPDNDCHRAPTDILDATDELNWRVDSWVNYYQTAMPLLHSGPIFGANNKFVDYDTEDGITGHMRIVSHEPAWDEFFDRYERTIRWAIRFARPLPSSERHNAL